MEMERAGMEQFLTVQQVIADLRKLGIEIKDTQTVHGWIKAGKLVASMPFGRKFGWRIPRASYDEFKRKRAIPTAA